MTRVLLITSTFPISEKDTQIPWMRELLFGLKKKGIKIDVFAPSFRGCPNHQYFGINVFRFRYAPAFLETLTHQEGALFKLRQKPWLIFLPAFYLFFGLIATIRRIKKTKYDIIHVNWPFPQGIFGVVGKWLTKDRLVLTFYGAEFALANRIPLGKTLIRFVLKYADRVIAISTFTKRKILEIKPVPVKVIPFASGITMVGKMKKPEKKKSSKNILFVGRLIERKGVTYLIKAMPIVLKSLNARLDIVGSGPLFSNLKIEIEKNKLEKNVFLHGKVSEKKLVDFYRNCDVFVLPAIKDKWGDTEGLGVVLLEAMSFKKPVIATRVGGITDIVKNNLTGILVPQKNSYLLAKAIIKILTNQKLSKKLTEGGYQYLKKNFNWEKILCQIAEIYC